MSSECTANTESPYRTLDEIKDLISEFELCTLPRERWTHQAHLTVALWYLARNEREVGTTLIRRNIQKYNHAHNILTTKESVYHETITLFFVWVVCSYLSRARPCNSMLDLANGLIKSCGDKNLPLEYYSKERLMSLEARTRWLEPDLKPLS